VPRVRQLEALVALTLAAAVAFILITPDCNDDVDAILHHVKAANSHAVGFVSTLNTALIMRVSGRLYASSASSVMSHVRELLCTYRC
jgi:hypothetical protein